MNGHNPWNSHQHALPAVRETKIRTILQPTRMTGEALRWGADPYEGCDHGCWHCYNRATHDIPADPHSGLEHLTHARVNAPQVLARELTRRSWNRAPVRLGLTADPYQPAERSYRLTRRMVEVFLAYKTPLEIGTRSHLILDDLELLVEYSHKLPLTVTVPLATMDDGLLELLEPAADSAPLRLQTVARLASAGISTGVLMSPLFPGLTDSWEQMAAVAKQAANAGARYFKAIPLTLERNAYQGLMPFLEEHFPELHLAYKTLYRGARLHPHHAARIRALGQEAAAAYRLETQARLRHSPGTAPAPHQLSLYGFSSG